jgi:hypothetical protein
MKKIKFLYIVWLLPAYFFVMVYYQWQVLQGLQDTYNQGESLIASIIDFDIKQIAAQTNGYVDLSFTPSDGETREQRLTLSVQMAASIMESEVVPIRFLETSFEPIVMTTTYPLHRRVVLTNMAMLGLGFLGVFFLSIFVSRHISKRLKNGDKEMVLEFETES